MIRLMCMFCEQKYPEVFKSNVSLSVQPFSLEHFHIQGSRILSRSFSVPSSRAGRKKNGRQEAGAGDTSMQMDGDVSMQTDEGDKTLDLGDQTLKTVNDENEDEPEEEEDEEDDEDAEEEVMVPVADMLNAAYERDNVGCELLEYEQTNISAQQKLIVGKVVPRGRLFEDGHH